MVTTDWVQALGLVLNVVQAVLLAWLADRGRRFRSTDRRRGQHQAPPTADEDAEGGLCAP